MSPRLFKRDGSVMFGFHNPDGSWVEMPAPEGDAISVRVPDEQRPVIAPKATASAPEHVRQFLRDIGRRGGQARASRHSREQLAAWGRVRHRKAAKTPPKSNESLAPTQEVSR